jgi:hypothetical protein
MSEFGANHPSYQSLLDVMPTFSEPSLGAVLQQQLAKPMTVLDLTAWQLTKLRELNLNTVGDVLRASEDRLQTLYYVGEVRARSIRNTALAAVLEYLSG